MAIMKSTVLLQLKSLTLTYEPEAFPDVKETISKTILGNPGGIRYRQLDALKKVDVIRPLHFFPLRKSGSIISIMALAERITYHNGIPYYSFYVRYVSFNPAYSVKNAKSHDHSMAIHRMGNSFIKEGMKKHAEDFPFLLKDEKADEKKRIYYAYVEESNYRSLNYTEFFFEKIRDFTTITYSNIFPRADKRVSKISLSAYDTLSALLQTSFQKHTFFFLEKEKLLTGYYVLMEGEEIIAGVQAQVNNWKIEKLPGIMGGFIKNILPYLPVFSRVLKPKRFTFLTFDTIYCQKGSEQLLPVLFRSVCALTKVYAAMIHIDNADPLHYLLKKSKKMGLLNTLFSDAHSVVMAKFVNFTDKEKEPFYHNPVYFSGYDLT